VKADQGLIHTLLRFFLGNERCEGFLDFLILWTHVSMTFLRCVLQRRLHFSWMKIDESRCFCALSESSGFNEIAFLKSVSAFFIFSLAWRNFFHAEYRPDKNDGTNGDALWSSTQGLQFSYFPFVQKPAWHPFHNRFLSGFLPSIVFSGDPL
jgi:hypothetical protein